MRVIIPTLVGLVALGPPPQCRAAPGPNQPAPPLEMARDAQRRMSARASSTIILLPATAAFRALPDEEGMRGRSETPSCAQAASAHSMNMSLGKLNAHSANRDTQT